MNSRHFITAASGAAPASRSAAGQPLISEGLASSTTTASKLSGPRNDVSRHRFGLNYTPSNNWWFCWNDWNADPIKRDLDAIASLGADHLRILRSEEHTSELQSLR